jgi:hypothetical protein
MKILSVFLAGLLFVLTLGSLYEAFVIPKELISPLIPVSLVKGMQQAYIVHAVINFIFFLPFLYVAIKNEKFATFKILAIVFLLYISTYLVVSFIGING